MVETTTNSASLLVLPLWLMFIALLQKIAPSIITFLVRISHGSTKEERRLVDEKISCRKQLTQMSMTSEYVKYVKTERQIIKLDQSLKPLIDARKQSQDYARSSLNIAFYILLGLLFAITMYTSYYEPVAKNLSEDWFYPIGYIVGMPTGSTTCIGVPFFMLMFRTCINSVKHVWTLILLEIIVILII